MKIYGLTLVLLFANGSWCCSLRPNIPHYSITDRAVLAPLVIHGRVLNTTATRSFQQYRACVKVLEVIKGDSDLPREMCFGWFGMEELCLTHVFRDNEYIFYMNSDRTARYKDGVPTSAILANSRTTSLTKQGYCNPYLPQSTPCDRPTIKSFQSVIRVQEGQSAVMSCYASGTFPLLVTWSKMSSRLTHRIPHNYNQYRIPSVGVSDTGVYICTIRNPAGVTTALVRLYVDPVPCGAFLFLRPGEQSEIQSPNYPQPYSKDKMCSWRICPAHGQRVKLDFTHFDLRRNFDDNLQIYHECDPVRSSVNRYCSTSNPGRLVSKCTSHCIQVWFESSRYRSYATSQGFHSTVSSTDEGTSLFDYNTFYCENTILIRFIPRVAYFSTMTGRVLHNYKNTGPKPGQDIRIEFRAGRSKGLFGCYTEIKENREYYVGASVSSRSYTLRFVMLTDAQNKPDMFDQQLNKFKTLQRDCSPRPPASRAPTPEWPTEPPRTPKRATEPPRTPERATEPPRTPERATESPRTPERATEPPRTPESATEPPRPRTQERRPTEIPTGSLERPSPRGTPHPLDP